MNPRLAVTVPRTLHSRPHTGPRVAFSQELFFQDEFLDHYQDMHTHPSISLGWAAGGGGTLAAPLSRTRQGLEAALALVPPLPQPRVLANAAAWSWKQ